MSKIINTFRCVANTRASNDKNLKVTLNTLACNCNIWLDVCCTGFPLEFTSIS